MILVAFIVALLLSGALVVMRRPSLKASSIVLGVATALELIVLLSLGPADAVDCVECGVGQVALSVVGLSVLPAVLIAALAWALFWAESR